MGNGTSPGSCGSVVAVRGGVCVWSNFPVGQEKAVASSFRDLCVGLLIINISMHIYIHSHTPNAFKNFSVQRTNYMEEVLCRIMSSFTLNMANSFRCQIINIC